MATIFGWGTTENKIYNDIKDLVSYLREKKAAKETDIFLDESKLFGDYKSPVRRTDNQKFNKNVINTFNFDFSISLFEYNIFKVLEKTKTQTQQQRFDFFFAHTLDLLTEFHWLYLEGLYHGWDWNREISDEAINKIILNEAFINRAKPLKEKELTLIINDRLLEIPRTKNNKAIYNFYLRNIPQKIIKTKDGKRKATNTLFKQKEPKKEETEANKDLNPWRTRTKANDYMIRNGWEEEKRLKWNEDVLRDSFNFKQQKKNYMLRTIAPRHTIIIDYFFPGKFIYLLCVNVNTRKAYAIPAPNTRQINESSWTISKQGNKTDDTALKQFKELLKMAKVKHVVCDKEKAFTSNIFKDFCKQKGIELNFYVKNEINDEYAKDTSRGNHGTLSILDRLCRTLRTMNHNLGNDENITPDTMKFLIEEYNNSIHSTLSKEAGFAVSPNMVDRDEKLENKIINEIAKDNIIKKLKGNWNIKGLNVRCYNEAGKFDKVKKKLLPGKWKVMGNDGGLFVVKQGEKTMKMPRWMLKTVF